MTENWNSKNWIKNLTENWNREANSFVAIYVCNSYTFVTTYTLYVRQLICRIYEDIRTLKEDWKMKQRKNETKNNHQLRKTFEPETKTEAQK